MQLEKRVLKGLRRRNGVWIGGAWAVVCAVLLAVAGRPAFAESIGNWRYRIPVTFSGYTAAETLTNFPALVVFNTNITNFSYSLLQAPGTGGDLRFYDRNYSNLNYEIEQWNTNGDSYVWVQVPSLAGSNDQIWAYFGGALTGTPVCATNGAAWSGGYRGVWHLGDVNALDSSSNRFHGTAYGPTNMLGRIGSAKQFGGDDYIGLGTGTNPIYALPAFSFSWWMYEATHVSGAQISSDAYPGLQSNRFILQDNSAQSVQPVYADGRVFSTANYVADGQWHHYSLTVDNVSGGQWRFYVDGSLAGATNWAFTAATHEMQFGKHSTSYFSGGLDEIQISSVARSSNWIWAAYINQASNGVFCSYGQVDDVGCGTVIIIR